MGVSPKTVRRRVKKGLLEARKEAFRGGYRSLVRIEAEEARVDKAAQEATQVSTQMPTLEIEALVKAATDTLDEQGG